MCGWNCGDSCGGRSSVADMCRCRDCGDGVTILAIDGGGNGSGDTTIVDVDTDGLVVGGVCGSVVVVEEVSVTTTADGVVVVELCRFLT